MIKAIVSQFISTRYDYTACALSVIVFSVAYYQCWLHGYDGQGVLIFPCPKPLILGNLQQPLPRYTSTCCRFLSGHMYTFTLHTLSVPLQEIFTKSVVLHTFFFWQYVHMYVCNMVRGAIVHIRTCVSTANFGLEALCTYIHAIPIKP